MTTVPVKASREYEVRIGSGLLRGAGEVVRQVCGGEAVMLVCGDIVNGLYADGVQGSLEAAGFRVCRFVYPHGERSKTAQTYFSLLNALAENGLTRSDCIVALGGGVTGDLAGFAAATYQRGVHYVQIPTTLLAAVDSSVGGKTAIDLPAGKNLAGAFYQPSLVLCDYDTLNTLPEDVFTDGCAEVIKYGVIWSEGLFERLKAPIRPQLEMVIARCVEIKRDVVQQDEFDTGVRGLLNFGHTIGHAVEKCSDFAVSHGRAVAIGMALITKAAYLVGICEKACVDEMFALLRQYGLPVSTKFAAEELLSAMRSDKKRAGNSITLVLPEAIGKCRLEKLPVEEMRAFLCPALEDQTWM
ncbi:MAG: 3-dehydroquinate synthase [Oscillospiraceae bacterium]|nr:3-dehydroquinate synthase [Oscillospiraceae bacterium]